MDLGYGVNATVARAEEQEDPQVASGGRARIAATVRYQVWAHLMDSKAKRIEALYAQLGNHRRVPAFAEIQCDAHLCFPGDVRLSQLNGLLVTLLQAYLTMVPDIRYCKGGILYRLYVLVQRV